MEEKLIMNTIGYDIVMGVVIGFVVFLFVVAMVEGFK